MATFRKTTTYPRPWGLGLLVLGSTVFRMGLHLVGF